jgi:hypothetical protein
VPVLVGTKEEYPPPFMSDVNGVKFSKVPSGFSTVTLILFHVVPAIGLGIASHQFMLIVWPTPRGFGVALMNSRVWISTADTFAVIRSLKLALEKSQSMKLSCFCSFSFFS